MISPGEFIPIAEETGLIHGIGSWVLREACRQMRVWREEGLPAAKVAINVSALEMARLTFADEVADVLHAEQLAPGMLELELTESAIMSNLAESTRQMWKLQAMGVRIAVDDFGTGYSSLAYLQNLPINTLKIDRTFVQGIGGSASGLPVVQAMLNLARDLGLTVVAEGVETSNQLAALRQSRCDVLQGYLFCHPRPAAEVRQFLLPEEENAMHAV